MADLTTDPKDSRLGHGADEGPVPQNEAYLVLSQDEINKGFKRPFRRTYIHVGVGGSEAARTSPGCGGATTMGVRLAETYAADPSFYGATYCVKCMAHRPVAEFVWEDGSVVGS